jgi:5'-3' exonuclease
MENILFNKKSGSYIIFSPDSDVVLLSLIMQNKLIKNNIENTFNLIRHNQIDNEIENISICKLRNNIYNFIYNKMNNYRKNNHSKSNIIDDIVGLFTFFGNDFLPKIESINRTTGDIVISSLPTNFSTSIQFDFIKNKYLNNFKLIDV